MKEIFRRKVYDHCPQALSPNLQICDNIANGSNDFRIKLQGSILVDNMFAFNKILYTRIVT